MALIGKIRNNFWFVLLVLGLALAAFVIMDMVSAGNQGGVGPKQIIGEVAGSDIDYQDFTKTEQALFSGSEDSYVGKTGTWNYLMEKNIIEKQAEALGVNVSNDELSDLQFGTNLSPVIRQIYTNPQTGQIEMQNLLEIKQALESEDELNPTFRMNWEYIQKNIIKTAKQEKINALVSKSIYTPNFVAENTGMRTSQKASFDFVKIPFDYLEDSDVEVTDAAITDYINENKFRYTNDEETRIAEYASFEVLATSSDSTDISEYLASLAETFKTKNTAIEDSLFTINNEGYYNPFYIGVENITGDLKEGVAEMEVKDVFGPYLDNGGYFIAKLTGKGVVPDSVEIRHILRSANPANAIEIANARVYIDSLKTLIDNRTKTFNELVLNNSQDNSTNSIEGDLGTIAQGTTLPAINETCIVNSKEGGHYVVQTANGVHLFKVTKRIFNSKDPKYKLALIRSAIVPSEKTQNAVYEQADGVITANKTWADVKKAVEGMSNVTIEKTSPLKKNDYILENLGSGESSRDAIKWVFENDTEVGEVAADIFDYSDPINYYDNKYVLVGLSKITNAGTITASDFLENDRVLVANKLKGDKIASQISGTDLAAIASTFNSTVESASDIAFTASTVTGLGNEPDVLSAVFAQAEGGVSKPIIGNTGVYVVKTNAKVEGTVPANVIEQKRTLTAANRNRVSFSLMNALKEIFKPVDNRYDYF